MTSDELTRRLATDVAGFEERVASLRARLEDLQDGGNAYLDQASLVEELTAAYEQLSLAWEELETHREAPVPVLQQHERVIAGLPVAVVTSDSDGTILFANVAAVQLLDRSALRLVGSPIAEIFDDPHHAAIRTAVAALATSGSTTPTHRAELATRHGPGREVTVSGSVSRLGNQPLLTWILQPPALDDEQESSQLLPRALVMLAELPALCRGLDELIPRACEVCQTALGTGTSVSLMLGDPRRPDMISSTSQLGQAVDGSQIVADQGPCLEAHQTGQVVVVDRLHDDSRWPRLREQVADLDVGGVIALPVTLAGTRIGAFNVFLPTHRSPTPLLVERCRFLVTALEAALAEVTLRAELETTAEGLRTALTSRALIDQAKGIIMADKGCSAEEAFSHMVALSSRSHVKVRDIAAALIEGSTRTG